MNKKYRDTQSAYAYNLAIQGVVHDMENTSRSETITPAWSYLELSSKELPGREALLAYIRTMEQSGYRLDTVTMHYGEHWQAQRWLEILLFYPGDTMPSIRLCINMIEAKMIETKHESALTKE